MCDDPHSDLYYVHQQGRPPVTTASFTDYVATQDARNEIQLNVRKYTLMLCDALVDNWPQLTSVIIRSVEKVRN